MATTPQTLGGMKTRIALELARGNSLSQQIEDAIATAIRIYQAERFKFNEARPFNPVSFNTVASTPYYLLSAIAGIGDPDGLFHVDYLNVLIGSTYAELSRKQPEEIRLLNMAGTESGQPDSFAIEGETIMIYPIPSAAWSILIGGHFAVAAPVSDDEIGNRWMTTAERLIRSRAKYEIALHNTRNDKMVQMMSPYPPEQNGGVVGATYDAFNELKAEAAKLVMRGRVRPTAF